MEVRPIKTEVFREGDDLLKFVVRYVPKLKNESVLAVTSKIVALSERRVVPLSEKERIIRAESAWAVKARYVWLTLKDGILLANAGVDASNADGKLLLLPKDSFISAHSLRRRLRAYYGIKKLGVLITDSRVTPMRNGVIGVAVGYAGFKGLRDYRGKKDIFGRTLKFTGVNVADSLATAAAFAMGEGKEQQPLAVITNAPVEFANRVSRKELLIAAKDDMYAPLLRNVARGRRLRRR